METPGVGAKARRGESGRAVSSVRKQRDTAHFFLSSSRASTCAACVSLCFSTVRRRALHRKERRSGQHQPTRL